MMEEAKGKHSSSQSDPTNVSPWSPLSISDDSLSLSSRIQTKTMPSFSHSSSEASLSDKDEVMDDKVESQDFNDYLDEYYEGMYDELQRQIDDEIDKALQKKLDEALHEQIGRALLDEKLFMVKRAFCNEEERDHIRLALSLRQIASTHDANGPVMKLSDYKNKNIVVPKK
eukprot:CAMPEP_0202488854 /NCGR_PEP_ID=MMETSP1361-20130828/6784_1 /ASSEMBLY_ACC=CAM_ASM_000849 /TAXON_ID=210615 /ORGANISM="Staurosira complex sp., Strain CCMP2646" /LENGTH=170 /DNA_ID=CAMNT_0049118521 /DNA_START=39 /DNA_END=551 /DNA_ORIENTATION=-